MAYSSVELDAGSGGDTIATDTVATKKYQIIKVATGGEGTATEISNANPVPVSDAGGSLTVDGTVTANLSATDNAVLDAIAASVAGTLTVDTELPAAAALADNAANPTAPAVGAHGLLWDGATWDRAPGTAADGQLVNLGSNNDVTVTGTVTVDLGANNDVTVTSGSITADTELPTAAALADNAANPTAPAVGSFGMVWDGATWDRMPGTSADGVTVNLAGNNDVTVTGTVDLGATDNAVLDTIASPVATISATPLQRVAIFDAADAQITSFGGGTQYTEDAAAAANPVGTAPIFVRQDTPATLTTTDGDNVAGRATNYGAQFVQIVTSSGSFVDSFSGSGGTSEVDDADFTAATTAGTPAMGVYESTPTNVTDGDLGIAAITITRELKTSDASAAALLTTIDSDTSAMNTNLATVAGAVSGTEMQVDVLTMPTVTVDLGVNNDVTVTGTVDLGATDNAVLDSIDGKLTTIDADTSGLFGAIGTSGSAAPSTSLQVGLLALTADPTAVDTGDNVRPLATGTGKQVTLPYAIPASTWSYAAASGGITDTTGVTAKAAGTGSQRQYITHVSVVNGHATVGTDVQIRDGAAGTVLWRSYAVAAGGGVSEKFDPPLRGSAATLVEIANGTTGSATYFNLQGYTAAE